MSVTWDKGEILLPLESIVSRQKIVWRVLPYSGDQSSNCYREIMKKRLKSWNITRGKWTSMNILKNCWERSSRTSIWVLFIQYVNYCLLSGDLLPAPHVTPICNNYSLSVRRDLRIELEKYAINTSKHRTDVWKRRTILFRIFSADFV